MPRTTTRKIVDAHRIDSPAEGIVALKVDLRVCHEITTPPAFLEIANKYGDKVYDPSSVFGVIDHVMPAVDSATALQHLVMRQETAKHGIQFADVGRSGVCHAIVPELRKPRPGMTIVCGDSHTCTYGAFGALAIGIGTTALEAALLTGVMLTRDPKVMKITLEGKLSQGVYAKDVILNLIKQIGVSGATDYVVEFVGPIADAMTMEERMTVSNMAVEMGATSGLFLPDVETAAYLVGYESAADMYANAPLAGTGSSVRSDYADLAAEFRELYPDPDASYDRTFLETFSNLEPQITWGENPSEVTTVREMVGKKVDQVYIGSCTNGRISDLREAAKVIKGRMIPAGVRCIVVPATTKIQQQAIKEGLADIFIDAGCQFSAPTCGACLGMSNGVIASGEVCVSTTNRNFSGRMGKGGTVHLASPATAAATACYGEVTDAREVKLNA